MSESEMKYPLVDKKYPVPWESNLQIDEKLSFTREQMRQPGFDAKKIMQDFDEAAKQNEAKKHRYQVHSIVAEILPSVEHWGDDLTEEEAEAKAANGTINSLKQAVSYAEATIEQRETVKDNIQRRFTQENLLAALYGSRQFTDIDLPNFKHFISVFSLTEVEEHLALAKEKVALLDEDIAYQNRLKAIFVAQIQKLVAEARPILARKLCEISQVVKEGLIEREAMVSTLTSCHKHGTVDTGRAHGYMGNKRDFASLQSRYIHLRADITKYADPSTLNIPDFPADLTPDERALGEMEILAEAEKVKVKPS